MAMEKITLISSPSISIIVPVYNAEGTIKRCLDSLVSQTYKDIEIIAVNDGSIDSSGAICDDYAKNDSRVKVCHTENNGVSRARNIGIQKAQGFYILFVDSDDYLTDTACEILVNHQLALDDDCVVYGFRQLSGSIWAPGYSQHYSSLKEFKKDYIQWINTELLSSSVNKLYKRSKVVKSFPDNMSFGEDLIFSLDYLSSCETISFITSPLYVHDNLNVNSLSHSFNLNRFRDIEIIQEAILCFDDNIDDNRIYSKYISDCVRIVRECLRMATHSFSQKKCYLYSWLKKSYLSSLCLRPYSMDWRNRLMMFCFKNRMLFLSYLVVNGKRILKRLVK